jgi:hypothetical protein
MLNTSDEQHTASYEAKMKVAVAPYNLPIISYEGGQGLVAFPHNAWGSPISNLYVSAQRDARMAAVYTKALSDWKANGGTLYTVFADISPPSVYGNFGALESVYDTVTPLSSAPPKWQALQNFISQNQCWWANCVGTIGTATAPTPMPPSNVTVK